MVVLHAPQYPEQRWTALQWQLPEWTALQWQLLEEHLTLNYVAIRPTHFQVSKRSTPSTAVRLDSSNTASPWKRHVELIMANLFGTAQGTRACSKGNWLGTQLFTTSTKYDLKNWFHSLISMYVLIWFKHEVDLDRGLLLLSTRYQHVAGRLSYSAGRLVSCIYTGYCMVNFISLGITVKSGPHTIAWGKW